MDNTLEKNLKLRKALAEVDRLTSENVSLDYINSEQQIIIKDLKDDVNGLREDVSYLLDLINKIEVDRLTKK